MALPPAGSALHGVRAVSPCAGAILAVGRVADGRRAEATRAEAAGPACAWAQRSRDAVAGGGGLAEPRGQQPPARQQSPRDAHAAGPKDAAKALLKQRASTLPLAGFGLVSSRRHNPSGCLRNLSASF